MSVQAKAYFRATFLFLFLWVAAVAAAAGFMVTTEHIKEARAVPPKLPAWSDQRILGELGEAAQVMPCDDIVGAPGLTARFFVQEKSRRLIVVCTTDK